MRCAAVWIAFVLLIGTQCAAQTTTTTFTYQGTLAWQGSPFTGTADVQFELYDAVNGGNQIGPTLVLTSLDIDNGLMQADLDFGAAPFDGTSMWLDIQVRTPPGAGVYIRLTPRQAITSAPFSIQTRGIFVDEFNQIGIGTTSPEMTLEVHRNIGPGSTPRIGTTGVFSSRPYWLTMGLNPAPTIAWNPTSTLRFGTSDYANSAGFNELFSIDPAGSVGFGTTASPSSHIAVHADTEDHAIVATGGTDTSISGGGTLVLGDVMGPNVSLDSNEIMARNAGAAATLYLNADGGEIRFGVQRTSSVFAYCRIAPNGAVVSSSANIASVTHPSDGVYNIYVDGGVQQSDIIIATSHSSSMVIVRAYSSGGSSYKVRVDKLSTPSTSIDGEFSLVVFRP
ncbi:MAG: hypothetical protein H6815_02255 [Phycisphaeraceae bacterium]|nr:hypothetical protein [Phycisphaerales bacterium]MCB9859250.1 hypothetical protein [Phycisphaeraceae bacterium]